MAQSTLFQRTGWCPRCQRRVQHTHTGSGPVWWLHWLTLNALPRLGLGGWSCDSCYSRQWWLRGVFRRTARKEDEFEQAGNFLLADYSLIRRSLRNSRYSRKFRDSVVDRLLTGQARIDSIREELKIREPDLLAWIGDRIHRQQERIAELSRLLELLAGNQILERLEGPADDSDPADISPELRETAQDVLLETLTDFPAPNQDHRRDPVQSQAPHQHREPAENRHRHH